MDQTQELLLKLLKINSKTFNASGINQVQNLVQMELEELGFKVNRHDSDEYGDLLVGELPGYTKNFITMICHADTVFSPDENSLYSSKEEDRIYGPGTIDDKGGICVALKAIKSFLKYNTSLIYGLRFVCSPNEEIGSVGFQEHFKSLCSDSPIILGFEPSNERGDIIVGRKGNRWYDIHVVGKKAHAGRHFKDGINACGALSSQLHQINKLTELDKGVTVNIGKIEGGDTYNVVSDSAYGQLDVRFPSFEERENICNKIEQQLADGLMGTSIKYDVVDDCPPFSSSKEARDIVDEYIDIIYELEGRSVRAIEVGGASDCNYFSSPNNLVIDGLGPIGGGMHTNDEYIDVKSLHTRAEAVDKLLMLLQRK